MYYTLLLLEEGKKVQDKNIKHVSYTIILKKLYFQNRLHIWRLFLYFIYFKFNRCIIVKCLKAY